MGFIRHLDRTPSWLPRLMLLALTFLLSPEGAPILMHLRATWYLVHGSDPIL